MILDILHYIAASTQIIIALIVLINNPRRRVNQMLMVFALGSLSWILSNLFVNNSVVAGDALLGIRLTVVASAIVACGLLLFVVTFVKSTVSNGKLLIIGSPVVVAGLITSFSGSGVISASSYGLRFEVGWVYTLFLVILGIYFFMAIVFLIKNSARLSGSEKVQNDYLLIGVLTSVMGGFVANGVLPLFGLEASASFGALSSISFSVFASIAILRHRLFDIRGVITRLVGFLAALAIAAGVSALLLLLLGRLFLSNTVIPFYEQVVFVGISLILAVGFSRLKMVTEKLTAGIFLKDSYYDPQVVLNDVGLALVKEIELTKLTQSSMMIISNALRSEYISIISGEAERMIVGRERDIYVGRPELNQINDWGRDNLINIETDGYGDEALKKVFVKSGASILVRLMVGDKFIGFMIVGQKVNGLTFSSGDENLLRILASEISMAMHSSSQFEEIKMFNTKLQGEVERATFDLKRSNAKLKALDEAKDEFISMASHQLRTPLTSVKGYISMVMEGDAGEIGEKQHELLSEAFTSSQRMVYLIADLLNVSRLRTGKFLIERAPINLADVVESEIKQLRETAKSRNLKLIFDKPEHFPLIDLDETKTRQVIMNFADNAIYYTPSGGEIEIQLKATKNTIEYRVVDNGIGVKRADQKHLFTKFFRASNAKRARPDGTGLGLYMAQKVISAQGGAVVFKSKENKGSTFGFSFPRKQDSKKPVKAKKKITSKES